MNIMVVDDEKYALKDLVETIKQTIEDVSVVSFSSYKESIDWVLNNKIDIAFLDIELNEQSGLDLAKNILEVQNDTNIIFVTGYSEYALDAFNLYASDYIMKPVTADKINTAFDNLRRPIPLSEDKGLRIQTFGNFEVFYDGEPLAFPRAKAKELLAYLIHKKGTGCSSKEAASILFEDKPYNKSIQKQIQTILSTLMKILRQIKQEDIIIKRFNNISVDVKKINCDYYNFLDKDPDAINRYTGEYMSNYGWAEFTIGYLDSKV